MATFREELEKLINIHNQERGSNTPDFILANFLTRCLENFDEAVNQRQNWYGFLETKQTESNIQIDDLELGLYPKFTVIRNDGTSVLGRKHYGCRYFILDLDHDPYAIPALKAYADACQDRYQKLAKDLRHWLLTGKVNF